MDTPPAESAKTSTRRISHCPGARTLIYTSPPRREPSQDGNLTGNFVIRHQEKSMNSGEMSVTSKAFDTDSKSCSSREMIYPNPPRRTTKYFEERSNASHRDQCGQIVVANE